MLWPLSIAPERDCKPISTVPPSPPKATTFTSSFPCILNAASTPDATAPEFSNAT